ncbi:MAG: helix-turn-helix transcriptional regulator [Pirellulaceae bacterium]
MRNQLFNAAEWKALCRALELTPRQAEVINGILRCDSDKEIAAEMGVSTPTLRTHLQRLYRRFGVNDRTSLLVIVFLTFRREVSKC